MYDTEIQEKIAGLPEDLKREILDFIEFLTVRYSVSREHRDRESKNPSPGIAGFTEIGNMSPADIDREVRAQWREDPATDIVGICKSDVDDGSVHHDRDIYGL